MYVSCLLLAQRFLNTFYCPCLAAPLKHSCFPFFLSSPIRFSTHKQSLSLREILAPAPRPKPILILLRSKWNVSMVLFVSVLGLTTLRIHEYLS